MQLDVPPEAAGERLDAFLAQPLGSRSQAARLIAAGLVLVDGTAARKGQPLRGGERIEVRDEERAPSAVVADAEAPVARFEVAYEDDHLLVVDKPAGVVVHPARGHREGTLAQALAGRIAGGEEAWRAGIVHRLDRETSGLLVVAKSEAAHRALKAALASRAMRREYLALVEGRPPARSGTIEAPIGRDRRVRTRMSTDTDSPKAGDHALRARAGAARRRRCCACGCRPAARTRSASTSRRSAIRSAAIRSTARPGCSACVASSCMRRGWRSHTR